MIKINFNVWPGPRAQSVFGSRASCRSTGASLVRWRTALYWLCGFCWKPTTSNIWTVRDRKTKKTKSRQCLVLWDTCNIFPILGSRTRTRRSLEVTASLLPSLLKLTDKSRASEGQRWRRGIKTTWTGDLSTEPAWDRSHSSTCTQTDTSEVSQCSFNLQWHGNKEQKATVWICLLLNLH